jgi:hypothetical protein
LIHVTAQSGGNTFNAPSSLRAGRGSYKARQATRRALGGLLGWNFHPNPDLPGCFLHFVTLMCSTHFFLICFKISFLITEKFTFINHEALVFND